MLRITKTGFLTRKRNVYEIRRSNKGVAYVWLNGEPFAKFNSLRKALAFVNERKHI